MKLAGFHVKKRLKDFDFEFQPLIDKKIIADFDKHEKQAWT